MDTTILLGLMAVAMVGVTIQARRIGKEKRDVAVLGAFSLLCGVGAVVSAIVEGQ